MKLCFLVIQWSRVEMDKTVFLTPTEWVRHSGYNYPQYWGCLCLIPLWKTFPSETISSLNLTYRLSSNILTSQGSRRQWALGSRFLEKKEVGGISLSSLLRAMASYWEIKNECKQVLRFLRQQVSGLQKGFLCVYVEGEIFWALKPKVRLRH